MHFSAKSIIALVSAWLFVLTGAKAMTLENFGRMNNDDEATYVTLLIETSAKILKAQGQPDQASKTLTFFKTTGKDGGVQQLASHLRTMDGLNKRNAINPNNRVPVYQVEDAMELTLKEQGILVPAKSLQAATKDFRPSGLPRSLMGGP